MPGLVAESLALRAWALRVLAGQDSYGDTPVSSPSAWAHFLAVERCALRLSVRLEALGHQSLPVAAREALDRATHGEVQRILSARAELARVDQIASESDGDVVLLKGAVAVLGDLSRAVDLADVDLLAAPDDARALVEALDVDGYRIAGHSSPVHLATRAAPGALPVEVHPGLETADGEAFAALLSRSVPVAETKRLRRLASRDHLLHLLTHVGVDHPHRRGAIRDLLLLEHAVRECSAAELEEVRATIQRHRHATDLLSLLQMVRDLAAGQRSVVDRFQYLSGTVYAVKWHGERLLLPRTLRAHVGLWAVALLSGRRDLEAEWARVGMQTLGASRTPLIAWVERSMPRLGRAVRVVSRAIRAVVAIVFAVPLALLARYETRRAIRASG